MLQEIKGFTNEKSRRESGELSVEEQQLQKMWTEEEQKKSKKLTWAEMQKQKYIAKFYQPLNKQK